MKKLLLLICLFSGYTYADVSCSGTVRNIYKLSGEEYMSMRLSLSDGTVTRYIKLSTKSDESMALMALASKTPVEVNWNAGSGVEECIDGWNHNTPLEGYFALGE